MLNLPYFIYFSHIKPNYQEVNRLRVDAPTEDQYKSFAPNGTPNAQSSNQSDIQYESTNIVRKHAGNSVPRDFHNRVFERSRKITPPLSGENNKNLSDLDKKRSQFRRSPSYTNAISVDSDPKDANCLNTVEAPPFYSEASPKRCPSYSQAVDELPLITKRESEKQNTKTKYFDGKYYVGVVADTDDSAL